MARPGGERSESDSLTVAESPSAQSRRFRRTTEASSIATVTSTRALFAEEAARTRAFAAVLGALVAVAIVFVPFQTVPTWLTVVMIATLAMVACLCVWVYRNSDRARFSHRVYRTFAVGCASVALVVVYYGGVFSAANVVVVLGLGFFALSDDRRFIIYLAAAVVGGYLVLAIAVALELVPEHGLVVDPSLSTQAKVFNVAVTTSIFAVTVWHARLARGATRDAVGQLSLALAELQQREALVREANEQLDAALNIDAGKRGRFTGSHAGDYLLGELIGRGAMGEVYSAVLDVGGEPVAIKVLADRTRATSVDRFRREARISGQLESDNVVRVLEIGELDGGNPYIAMELLEGNDLAWHLRKRRRLSPAEVVDMVYQVSCGLDAAHDSGVVHRDIKPNNLFYDTRRSPSVWKILDFGVARDVASEGTLTQGAVVGTPGYMAPEQAEGKVPDRRADVFSLAAVAYRALTGQPALSGRNAPETMYQVVHHQPRRPSPLVESAGEDAIDAVFAVGFAKVPGERFESAGAFAAALEGATRGTIDETVIERAGAILASAPWADELPPTLG